MSYNAALLQKPVRPMTHSISWSSLCALTLCAGLTAQGFTWTIDLDAARKRAEQEKRVLVVAVHIHEDWMAREYLKLYADHRVAPLGRSTINVLCYTDLKKAPKVWPAIEPLSRWEEEERKVCALLGRSTDERQPVPTHVFFGPDGQLISSFAGRVTPGELEWAWADAVHRGGGTTDWKASDRCRAPASLMYGKVAGSRLRPALNPKELSQLSTKVQDLPSTKLGDVGKYVDLFRSLEYEARRYAKGGMRMGKSRQGRRRGGEEKNEESAVIGLRAIAEMSPPVWWEVGDYWLVRGQADTRTAAARALRSLRTPRAKNTLTKAYAKEADVTAKGEILKALAACTPTSLTTYNHIKKGLTKVLDIKFRVAATQALGLLEHRERFEAGIRLAFADEAPKVRAAAARVVAWHRDRSLEQFLQEVRSREGDTSVQSALDMALRAMDGGKLDTAAQRSKRGG